jgi:hypothetical protein
MRGNPKDGYTCQFSNKHCKQKIVRVLLDSCSDGNLILLTKINPCCFPTQKGWFHSRGILQMGTSRRGAKARVELNFFKYSDSKRYHVEPDVVKYEKNNRPQYDLILGTVTMKELGIILDFRDKMITIDEIILPMRNINNLQGSSILRVLRHNHSLAMEPQSTQDATKHATRILDTKYSKAGL